MTYEKTHRCQINQTVDAQVNDVYELYHRKTQL